MKNFHPNMAKTKTLFLLSGYEQKLLSDINKKRNFHDKEYLLGKESTLKVKVLLCTLPRSVSDILGFPLKPE